MESPNEVRKGCNQTKAERICATLARLGYTVYQVDDIEAAKAKILELIPEGASVTMGGSAILDEMGLAEIFRSPQYKFFDRYQKLPFIPDRVEIMRQGMLADYLVTGCNAITEKGELVNRDCTGNRVAGMIFGPSQVVMVAGVNKIVRNLEEAFARLEEVCAPLNARRLGSHKTGCLETGICSHCDNEYTLCNYTTIIHRAKKFPGRLAMIIIAAEAGF
jgi:L-lactate utilization protein LutB